MEKIKNEQFGQFLNELRKEKKLTQMELAEKLYISDKAVSKWERGLSMPDISLLLPLSQILGVTTTELLSGKRIRLDTKLTVVEVESLMNKTIGLSKEESEQQSKNKQRRMIIFSLSIVAFALEMVIFYVWGYPMDVISENMLLVELLMFIFGTYFTFFAKEALPVYYDENKINFYHDGFFRMNIPGVRLNNSNWKHILPTAQITIMGIFALFPLLFLGVSFVSPMIWEKGELFLTLGTVCSIFIPIYIVGKKYE